MIQTLVITELNATTHTAITLPTNQGCGSFAVWTEDGSAFYISSVAAGTDEGLTLANMAVSINAKHYKGETVMYAKSSSGTPNLVLLVTK